MTSTCSMICVCIHACAHTHTINMQINKMQKSLKQTKTPTRQLSPYWRNKWRLKLQWDVTSIQLERQLKKTYTLVMMWIKGPLMHSCGNIKLLTYKLKLYLPNHASIPLLGMYRKQMKSAYNRQSYKPLLVAVLLLLAKVEIDSQ